MGGGRFGNLMQFLRGIGGGRGSADLCDRALLDRFVATKDEAAFATLLERHGPMVLGVCRRMLGDSHQVEDVFQATFLVLVRKAAALRSRDRVGNWLYGVATRLALKARSTAARQAVKQSEITDMATAAETHWSDLRPILDEELQRLPDKYREPFVLCYLEGKTTLPTAWWSYIIGPGPRRASFATS